MKHIDNTYHVISSIEGLQWDQTTSYIPLLFGEAQWPEVYDHVRAIATKCPGHIGNSVMGKKFEGIIKAIAWADPTKAHEWFAYLIEPIIIPPMMPDGRPFDPPLRYQPADVSHMIMGMFGWVVEYSRSSAFMTMPMSIPILKEFPILVMSLIWTQLGLGHNRVLSDSKQVPLNDTVEMLWQERAATCFSNVSQLENILKWYCRLHYVVDGKARADLYGADCSDGPNELYRLLSNAVKETEEYNRTCPLEGRVIEVSEYGKSFLEAFDYACRSNLSVTERYAP
ncbi:MAG: hypothetical protein WD544_01990 [Patescibacteria group bacterium]